MRFDISLTTKQSESNRQSLSGMSFFPPSVFRWLYIGILHSFFFSNWVGKKTNKQKLTLISTDIRSKFWWIEIECQFDHYIISKVYINSCRLPWFKPSQAVCFRLSFSTCIVYILIKSGKPHFEYVCVTLSLNTLNSFKCLRSTQRKNTTRFHHQSIAVTYLFFLF